MTSRALDRWVALLKLGVYSASARALSHLCAALGVAGVVAVFVAVLAVAEGFRATLFAGVDSDTVMVLRSGANSELVSVLSGAEARIVASLPEWRRGPRGPDVSPELFLVLALERHDGDAASATLRGVGEGASRVRERFSIVEGRSLSWGRNELLVGASARHIFAGLGVGDEVAIAGQKWPVVGVFQTGGREDSELWGDARVLQSLFRRGAGFQAVYAKLRDPSVLTRARESLRRDLRLHVDVHLQSEYYARQAEPVTQVVRTFGSLLCLLMGAGAAFATLDTMYASVYARRREIAMLRALGFPRLPLLASVVTESLVIGVLGGVVGASIAYFACDGLRATTLDFRSLSQVAFRLAVTPRLAAEGILVAILLGFAGALPPALNALRMPVAAALKRAG